MRFARGGRAIEWTPGRSMRCKTSPACAWRSTSCGRYGSKHYNHPLVGDITVLHEATQLAEGDQYLLLYAVEPGSPSEDAMHLLESMVATQAEQEPSNLLLA